MKKYLKFFLKYLIIFLILIITYIFLMTLSSVPSSSLIKNNVKESSRTLYEDGDILNIDLGYKKEELFLFTDAIMINTAYSIDSKRPIESFVLARKNYIPGQTKTEYKDINYHVKVSEKYRNKKTNERFPTKELYGLMHKDKIPDSYEYARYWHGYLVLLRPLLLLFDYKIIRIIMLISILISMSMMLYLIAKKLNIMISIIFFIGLMSVNVLIVSKSFNEILLFLISFISVIILLLKEKKLKDIGLFFFILGSITNFVDLFTTPLIPFGLSIITYFLLLQNMEKIDSKRCLKELLKLGILWVFGYSLTWVAKWIIVQLFFDRDIIRKVFIQILFRIGSIAGENRETYSALSVIVRNIFYLSLPTLLFTIAVSFIYTIVLKIGSGRKINLSKCFPYFIISFFPIIWLTIIKQHSYTHSCFVYRIFVISIVSFILMVYKSCEKK